MKTIILLIACSLTFASGIHLDGVINAEEWKAATTASLAKGGNIYYQRHGQILYIAVKGTSKGWSHVYLAHNDTVQIMHASAALGSLNFIPQNGKWTSSQKFNWQLRDRQFNEQAEQKQNDHYRQFGWAANNNNMGDGLTLEFKIDLSAFAGQKLAFAALFASDAADPHFYPAQLNDQTLLKELVYGDPPNQLSFTISNWHQL